MKISIHAPAKGATCGPSTIRLGQRYFNPRPREGSDLRNQKKNQKKILNFNPRPREGSDKSVQSQYSQDQYFNPRPREGSDDGKEGDE